MYGSTRSRTYANNIGNAKHIMQALGHYKMYELNKDILKEFIYGFTMKKYKSGKNEYYYSQSMINKVYNILSGAIQEAVKEGIISENFMVEIKKPRSNKPIKEEYKSFSEKEIEKISFIVSNDKMINLWIHILMYTGVRPSEALALKFSDINYQEGTLRILRTLSKEEFIDTLTHKKTAPSKPIITDLKNERNNGAINYQRRTLKIGDYLLNLLYKWESYVKKNEKYMTNKKLHGTDEFIFSSPNGDFWLYDDYNQKYQRLLKKSNVDFRKYNPYRFRHNYCTNLLRQGVDFKTVQMIMGDNTTEMVLRVYANMDKSDILKASGKYSKNIDNILCKRK